MTAFDDAMTKLKADLEWRGPNGHPQKHVTLERRLAQELLIAFAEGPITYQVRAETWAMTCFPMDHLIDVKVRAHRFLEEALELVQALGVERDDCMRLIDYVYGRPVGEAHQEVGGTLLTLACLCFATKMRLAECGEAELARVWKNIEKIRAKQAAKPKFDASPLP